MSEFAQILTLKLIVKVLICEERWLVVHFIDIGVIVNHQCLNLHFAIVYHQIYSHHFICAINILFLVYTCMIYEKIFAQLIIFFSRPNEITFSPSWNVNAPRWKTPKSGRYVYQMTWMWALFRFYSLHNRTL